jgi:hypothetical protein
VEAGLGVRHFSVSMGLGCSCPPFWNEAEEALVAPADGRRGEEARSFSFSFLWRLEERAFPLRLQSAGADWGWDVWLWVDFGLSACCCGRGDGPRSIPSTRRRLVFSPPPPIGCSSSPLLQCCAVNEEEEAEGAGAHDDQGSCDMLDVQDTKEEAVEAEADGVEMALDEKPEAANDEEEEAEEEGGGKERSRASMALRCS